MKRYTTMVIVLSFVVGLIFGSMFVNMVLCRDKNGKTIVSVQVGNPEGTIDRAKTKMDSPPVVINGRTMVPLRFISEAFGATTDWNALTKTARIVLGKSMVLMNGKGTTYRTKSDVFNAESGAIELEWSFISLEPEKFDASIVVWTEDGKVVETIDDLASLSKKTSSVSLDGKKTIKLEPGYYYVEFKSVQEMDKNDGWFLHINEL